MNSENIKKPLLPLESTEDSETFESQEIPLSEISKIYTNQPSTIEKKEIIMSLFTKKIAKKLNCSQGFAKALLFGLLHIGGTTSRTSPTLFFSIETIKSKTLILDLKTLRQISEQIIQETGNKFTLRQLARANSPEILDFAIQKNIQGNLSKIYKQTNPEFNPDDLIYCADYVDPDITNIPKDVSKFLINHKIEKTS